MPFAKNAVRMLADSKVSVTVCLWEHAGCNYRELEANGAVEILYFKNPDLSIRLSRLIARIFKWWFVEPYAFLLQIIFARFGRYDYICAVGQRGIVVGQAFQRLSGGRLLYFNDEFPSGVAFLWEAKPWARAEKVAVRRAHGIAVPDACRARRLFDELELTPGRIKTYVLPNAPLLRDGVVPRYWREQLEIDPGKKVVLHAGSVGDWVQIPEILSTIRNWPSDCALVIHSRAGDDGIAYEKSLSHLRDEKRIFWSRSKLEEEELNSLMSTTHCTLALYRNLGPNLELVGMSSGKIMRSIVLGVPVIATRFPSLSFIEEHGLGVLVTHPAEIAGAVEAVMARNEELRQNCLRFRETHADYRKHWAIFWREQQTAAT